ncbi:MAG: hypothetical protein RLZZ293_935 [Pseudomonadota bacterium]|jgi:magnesium chelatase family protein
MSIAKLYSRALSGMQAPQIVVEVHVAGGLPSFSIVGLPDTEIKESRDRIRSAIQNSGFEFPARRITVNLAPADLPKDSSRYDLPIALGILLASNLVKTQLDLEQIEFAGELALDGNLRPIKGALAIAFGISQAKRELILPISSAQEASVVGDIVLRGAKSLSNVVDHLNNKFELAQVALVEQELFTNLDSIEDFQQVKGQFGTKKALEIAAAGRHSLLMIGSPGCGKSMLAQRISGILPLLTQEQAITTASIYSLSTKGFNPSQWQQPPIRNPHHSTSHIAIVGGGSNPRPGEISLAHNGILFLDELPEFDRKVLEALREPLETKMINISRANHQVSYPADFQLIAAMNPCPCGYSNHKTQPCKCSIEQINRYRNKISGPLLDRIDIVVEVPSLTPHELQGLPSGEASSVIRQRVIQAREIQLSRQHKLNYQLNNDEIEQYCQLETNAKTLMQQIIDKYCLSARGYYRQLKLARTIADLDQAQTITAKHLSLAIQYKQII